MKQQPVKKYLNFGADHRGYEKKEQLYQHYVPISVNSGAFALDQSDDYNDPAKSVAETVAGRDDTFGVLICGSAHGMCMQANRMRGVRAINADSVASARTGRQHNDANVLCLAADNLSVRQMIKIIDTFRTTPALIDEKYQRRNEKLDQDFEPQVTQPHDAQPYDDAQPHDAFMQIDVKFKVTTDKEEKNGNN